MKTNINFYQVMTLANKPVINVRKVALRLLLIFALALNIGAIAFGFVLNELWKGVESEIAIRMDSPFNVENLAREVELEDGIYSAKTGIEVLQRLEENLFSVKNFETRYYTLAVGEKPADVTIKSMSFMGRDLRLDCISTQESSAADYTQELERLDVFSQVAYKGFTSSKDSGEVTFSLVCTVQEEAQNE